MRRHAPLQRSKDYSPPPVMGGGLEKFLADHARLNA